MSAKTKANANYQGALKQEEIANYLLRLSHLPYILRMMWTISVRTEKIPVIYDMSINVDMQMFIW